jgi:hypothetical protein
MRIMVVFLTRDVGLFISIDEMNLSKPLDAVKAGPAGRGRRVSPPHPEPGVI